MPRWPKALVVLSGTWVALSVVVGVARAGPPRPGEREKLRFAWMQWHHFRNARVSEEQLFRDLGNVGMTVFVDYLGGDAARTAEAEQALDDSGDGDGESPEDDSGNDDSGGGSKVKLKVWNQRRGKSMGLEAPEGKAVPLIDRIHRVMHLWKEGDVQKVDEYLDQHALRQGELFKRVVQSLIELSSNSERSISGVHQARAGRGAPPSALWSGSSMSRVAVATAVSRSCAASELSLEPIPSPAG